MINQGFSMVEHRRFELLTPTLPVLCATNCANAPRTSSIIAYSFCFVKGKEELFLQNRNFLAVEGKTGGWKKKNRPPQNGAKPCRKRIHIRRQKALKETAAAAFLKGRGQLRSLGGRFSPPVKEARKAWQTSSAQWAKTECFSRRRGSCVLASCCP